MSSDVYIDFNEDLQFEDYGNCLGHLGVMSYFGFNLLEGLRDLHESSNGIVTDWLPEAAAMVCRNFEHWCQGVDAGTQDKGSPYAWETGRWKGEFPTEDEIRDLLKSNLGKTWSIRVD